MSNFTYKLCSGSAPQELDASVQECLDAGYALSGGVSVSAFQGEDGLTTLVYAQNVLKKNI